MTDETYHKSLIIYIHCNTKLHGTAASLNRYSFSSYQNILSTSSTSIMRNEVIELFEDVEKFDLVHKNRAHDKINKELTLE